MTHIHFVHKKQIRHYLQNTDFIPTDFQKYLIDKKPNFCTYKKLKPIIFPEFYSFFLNHILCPTTNNLKSSKISAHPIYQM